MGVATNQTKTLNPDSPPQDDEYGRSHSSGLHTTGRVALNLWRIMRGEVNLGIYTLERCAMAVLRRRVPHIPQPQLAAWFKAGDARRSNY